MQHFIHEYHSIGSPPRRPSASRWLASSLPHSGKHALIIEDHALNAEVLSTLLEANGLTCTTIETPDDLARVLPQLERLDVIFLDLEFRYHNGFDVYQDLRLDPRTAGAPIVAYTVHISEADRARRLGFNSFLGKPLDQTRFSEQLDLILRGQAVWAY